MSVQVSPISIQNKHLTIRKPKISKKIKDILNKAGGREINDFNLKTQKLDSN